VKLVFKSMSYPKALFLIFLFFFTIFLAEAGFSYLNSNSGSEIILKIGSYLKNTPSFLVQKFKSVNLPRLSEKESNDNFTATSPTTSPSPFLSFYNYNFASSEFVYPGAVIIGQVGNTLVLKSEEEEEKIIDWYKNKIISLRMNNRSFIQTNTNGNIIVQLVGVDTKKELRIEMSKESSRSEVEILITFRNKETK